MQYDSSDSTPSMAFNVLASYANAGKFNSRQSAAVTALKIIPCFSCSSSTTDVARQLATVRGRYRGPASVNCGGRPVCWPMIFIALDLGLHSSLSTVDWPEFPEFPPSSLQVPLVHCYTFLLEPNSRLPRLGAGHRAYCGVHRVKQ